MDKFLAGGMKGINGWVVGSLLGDRAFFPRRFPAPRGRSQGGHLCNTAVEAVYPFTKHDATGARWTAASMDYTITFQRGSCLR